MEIVLSVPKPTMFRLRSSFLEQYYAQKDPFKSLLARSTYLNKYSRNGEVWSDTIRRVVEGNMALTHAASEQEAERLYHLFWTGQALPPGRGLWVGGVEGIPADARYNCFSGTTRFWANGRLASLKEAVGETIEVRCADAKWRPAEVKSFGRQTLRTVHLAAPGRSNFGFDFVVTPNHRWITTRGVVDDLRVGDRVVVTPDKPNHKSQSYRDGFAHGFISGDGTRQTLRDGCYNLRLCGEKDWQHEECLKTAGTFTTSSRPPSYNGDPVLHFKSAIDLKAVPSDATSLDYQAGFLAGLMAADGSLRSNGVGNNRLNSQKQEVLQWIADRAPLLGFCVTGWCTSSNMETNFGVRSAPLGQLTLSPEPVEYTVRSITDNGQEEEVFCVVEPETRTFTLEGGVPTGNCWYTTLYSPEDWCWVMNMLMLGGGVGVGLGEIDRLPAVSETPSRIAVWCKSEHLDVAEVKPNDKTFLNGQTPVYVADDSREGWVESLRRVMGAAFDGRDLIVDVSSIRRRGLPIKTFGGTACGPGPLTHLLRSVWSIIRGAKGRRLTSVEALDITNMVGFCVKSGNVRRSALIALGDAEDQAFRDAKKDFEKVLSHRHTSNNSIIFRSWDQIENFDWERLIDDNMNFGEPGVFNLPLVWKTDPGAKGVNPCFSGDTLIAVADGRNAVPIKQLAEEGKDVPVYSVDKTTGKVEIKMGRHPRVTGHKKSLVRVWLDDGSHLDTTPDHKFVRLDGSEVMASELEHGDSLPRFSKRLEKVVADGKFYYRVYGNTRDSHKGKSFEHRLVAKFYYPEQWASTYEACKRNGFANTGGLVVHHKDYDPLNNAPENLQIMTFREHAAFHARHDTVGEKNGRWSGISLAEMKDHGLSLTKTLGRRFSGNEWAAYAKEHGLPQQFSDFRLSLAGSVVSFSKLCASELHLDHVNEDPRVVRTYESMLGQGYDARIHNGRVLVAKKCEECEQSFEVAHTHRERSFCSKSCGSTYVNSDAGVREKRVGGLHKLYAGQMTAVRTNQTRVCSALKFNLGRSPSREEWSVACRAEKIPSRIGPTLKFGFTSFKQVLDAADNYNHKVVRVEELPGLHTVYNITVDDHHTVGVVTANDSGHWSGVYVAQCGEQALHDHEACNLAENFPGQHEAGTNSDESFRLLVRYCIRQRLTPLQDPVSHAVGLKNMRVGVALGGLCDFDWNEEMLAHWYRVCRKEADRYADELHVNRPITVTTVKPSGTISLLNGSSPGLHAPFAPFYLRRARIAKNDPMVGALIEAGVTHEVDQYDKTGHTLVFAFPTKAIHTRITVQTETIRDQFNRQRAVQDHWADNAVSATLSFNRDTEREELAACLKEHVPHLKSTSFLTKSHSYVQAPYEAIDESTYTTMYGNIRHDHPLIHGGDFEVDECASGVCPVR